MFLLTFSGRQSQKQNRPANATFAGRQVFPEGLGKTFSLA